MDHLIRARDTLLVTLHYPQGTPVESLPNPAFKDLYVEPARQEVVSASWHGREADFRLGLRQWGRRGEALQRAIEIRLEEP